MSLTPTFSAGTPSGTFSSSPTLPAGLSLDPATGAITGTLQGTSTDTSFTVTLSNGAGQVTFTVTITTNECSQTPYAGGDGSAASPYQVATVAQLERIHCDPMTNNYLLIANVDLTGYQFAPIGTSDLPYAGVFNGAGHAVSNFTYVSPPTMFGVGLFGATNGATLEYLAVLDANVQGGAAPQSGVLYGATGILVGAATSSTIQQVWTSGQVTGSVPPIGGVVGAMGGNSLPIADAYSTATVVAVAHAPPFAGTGGIVGSASVSTIERTYFSGAVLAPCTLGGIVGYPFNGTGIIESFDVGTVSPSDGTCVSYGAIGGYLDSAGANDVFWDATLTATNQCYACNCGGAPPVISAPPACTELDVDGGAPGYFANSANPPLSNWDFVGVWALPADGGYPVFRWSSGPEVTYPGSGVTVGLGDSVNLSPVLSPPLGQGTFSVSPNLPPGLTLNPATGAITGTLQAVDTDTSFTVTLTAPGGTGSATFTLNTTECSTSPYAGGDGSATNPFLIATVAQLERVHCDPMSNDYQLATSLDLAGFAFDPIGSGAAPYAGTFDGAGFTISNWSYLSAPTDYGVGLFGTTLGANLKHLGVLNANVQGGSAPFSGVQYGATGILVGLAGNTTIQQVWTTGQVTGSVPDVGGIAGFVNGDFLPIEDSYSSATVISLSGAPPFSGTGGIAGGGSVSSITRTYFSGQVIAPCTLGGIVGYPYNSTGTSESFDTGSVTPTSTGCLAFGAIGGYLDSAGASETYWDPTVSGTTQCYACNCGGGPPVVSAPPACTELDPDGGGAGYFMDSANPPLSTWDFSTIWFMPGDGGYPTLR